jgi:hypothetical protein
MVEMKKAINRKVGLLIRETSFGEQEGLGPVTHKN